MGKTSARSRTRANCVLRHLLNPLWSSSHPPPRRLWASKRLLYPTWTQEPCLDSSILVAAKWLEKQPLISKRTDAQAQFQSLWMTSGAAEQRRQVPMTCRAWSFLGPHRSPRAQPDHLLRMSQGQLLLSRISHPSRSEERRYEKVAMSRHCPDCLLTRFPLMLPFRSEGATKTYRCKFCLECRVAFDHLKWGCKHMPAHRSAFQCSTLPAAVMMTIFIFAQRPDDITFLHPDDGSCDSGSMSMSIQK